MTQKQKIREKYKFIMELSEVINNSTNPFFVECMISAFNKERRELKKLKILYKDC